MNRHPENNTVRKFGRWGCGHQEKRCKLAKDGNIKWSEVSVPGSKRRAKNGET